MTVLQNFSIGSFKINLHILFEILAYALGFRYFIILRSKKSDPIPEPHRLWILLGAALGALLGSRLLGVISTGALWNPRISILASLYGAKTIVGGLLGGLILVEFTKKIIHEEKPSGDLFVYPLILSITIGRIGCLLSGLEDGTYGNPTALPWGIDLGDGISRHPTSLYEISFLIFLFFILKRFELRIDSIPGMGFKIFMCSYLLFRLLVDFLKPAEVSIFGLTPIQLACTFGLIYYRDIIFLPVLNGYRHVRYNSF